MAGFSKEESYFSGRLFITLPHDLDQYSYYFFGEWLLDMRASTKEVTGDKTHAAQKFLFDIIPYLIQVLVTDGIYLVRDYPDHLVSLMLVNCIPNFLF